MVTCLPASGTSFSSHVCGIALIGSLALALNAGCTAQADIRPGDVRTYRIPRPAAAADRPRPPREPVAAGLRYGVPPGWEDRGASGMRLATLAMPPGGQHEVTVIPASGSLESNVARWVGQLDEAADEDTRQRRAAAAIAAAESLDVDGAKASVVLLLDAAAESSADAGQAVLAAIIPIDDTSALFVKFKGDAGVARRERENFTRFVSSIRWK
jgi:hypothetical protein